MEKLPKVVNAENTVLNSTIEVDMPLVKGVVPIGVDIKKVRVIAGNKTSTEFRDAEQYVLHFGGEHAKWQKKGGIVETDNFNYDIHWCEYDNKQYEQKLKGVKLV